jgi:protein gp37
MNRTKIEWTDFTWNPVVGCDHGCWYCYAKKMCLRFPKIFPNGFKPTFHPQRLDEPWKYRKPSKIFVCSISDLFAKWTPDEWRDQVLLSIVGCPVKHIFQLLTKNPERIPLDRKFPENVWIGTTVTNEGDDCRNIEAIKKLRAAVKFVSFEPLLGKLPREDQNLNGLDWIIIGKLTGSRKVQLDPSWVNHILGMADLWDIPVFIKNNILTSYPEFPKLQQFPREV